MSGFSLQEVLEQFYASNVVSHMLSGKAVERAVRGHFLVDSALNAMLVSKAFQKDLSVICQTQELESSVQTGSTEQPHKASHGDHGSHRHNEEGQSGTSEIEVDAEKHLLDQLSQMFEEVTSGRIAIADVQSSPLVQQVSDILLATKKCLQTSRNSKLWLQYMDMVDIIRKFLKAERTGHWKLHLQALQDMLPYLAASGHNLYTKSVYLYLQDMMKLQVQRRQVYTNFLQGYHVMHQSNIFWAGLSLDQAIEQILMKSVKTTGGLTRGRGMSEVQRLVWLMSRPTCLEINNTMQEYSSVSYSTSEQVNNTRRQHQEEWRGT